MRGRTVIFAALALLFAIVAIIYGTMGSPPVPDQASNSGRLTGEPGAPSTGTGDRLPPNARNEAPGEPRGSATGTTGAGGQAPDVSQPGVGTAPRTGEDR